MQQQDEVIKFMTTTVLILKPQDVNICLSHTHTNTIIHTALTIKPLASFHVCVLVTVTHKFLLVLLHQAVETVPIPALEMLLCCFDLLKNNKIKTKMRCDKVPTHTCFKK